MAKRRSNGEGSVSRVKSGWKAVFTVSVDPRVTRSKQPFKSKADALAWLMQQRSERDAATAAPAQSQMILAEWVDTWLAEVKRDKATSTHQAYEHHARGFLVPALGRYPLGDIKPMAIRNMLSDLDKEYGDRSTLQEVYKITRICFEAAKKLELIHRNPADQVSRPQYEREDIRPFSLAEVKAILEHASGHRLSALYVVAFSLGLRQGELHALEWGDIDWDGAKIRIERQAVNNRGRIEVKKPKTKSGRRTLELAPEVLTALRDRRAIAMKEGLAGCPLIFPAPRGGFIQRSSFAVRSWKPMLQRLGIEERGMHHCRHTFATHALIAGCPLHVVSAILGHANPSITLNIYSHLIDTAQGETVQKVAKLFAG